MKLLNNSGPAIFMYSVIAISLIISVICFGMFYGGKTESVAVLRTGIVFFIIMYHMWVRIIMGNVSKLFRKHINYKQWWFKERKFEKKLYKFLRVKDWKGKALTYNPEQFSVKDNSPEQLLDTMTKSEVDHWINEAISVGAMFFIIPWGKYIPGFLFIVTAIAAMIFDSQFIIIQRYNRPRVIKLIERENRKKEKVVTEV